MQLKYQQITLPEELFKAFHKTLFIYIYQNLIDKKVICQSFIYHYHDMTTHMISQLNIVS